MKDRSWFWFLARVFIGAVFAYAGFTKLMDPIENFRGSIAQYEVIPYSWTPLLAAVLPWVEFIGGMMMIVGYAPKLTALVIGGLCLGFTLVLGSSDLFLSLAPHDCGCFGEGSLIRLTTHQVFVLDSVNVLLCIGLYRQKRHRWSLDAMLDER